jgi:hypothetical protein
VTIDAVRRPFLLFLGTWILCAISQSHAAKIGEVFIKNNNRGAAAIWINRKYQGWVPGGATCYALVEGFLKENGESDGGWQSDTTLRFEALTYDDKNKPIMAG